MSEFPFELECELAYRGFDLRDCDDEDSTFTLRRLWVLYSGLPLRNLVSAAAAKLSREELSWSVTDFVLANVYDAVQSLDYTTKKINAPKGTNVAKPKPHPRPSRAVVRSRGMAFPGKQIFDKG
jgi:hypothetical protein